MAYSYEKTVAEQRARTERRPTPKRTGRSARDELDAARDAMLRAAESPGTWPRSHRFALVQRFLTAHRAVNPGRDIGQTEAAAIGALAPELDPRMQRALARPRSVREAEARKLEGDLARACGSAAPSARRPSASRGDRVLAVVDDQVVFAPARPSKSKLDREREEYWKRERAEYAAQRARMAARPVEPRTRRRDADDYLVVSSSRSMTRAAVARRIA